MFEGNISLGLVDLWSDVRPSIWIYPRIYTKITDTTCFVLTGLSSLTFVARLESILSRLLAISYYYCTTMLSLYNSHSYGDNDNNVTQ